MPFVITAPRRTRRASSKKWRPKRRARAPKVIIVRGNAPRRRRRRRNLPTSYRFTKLSPDYGPAKRTRTGGKFRGGWQGHAAWSKRKKSNPRRRRRRNNPLGLSRRRRRRRWMNAPRKAFRRRYRRNPSAMAQIRELFNVGTWVQAAWGLGGFSASLTIPRLLGTNVHPSFGRGFGGIATAAVGTALVSSFVSLVNVKAAKAVLAGGLIGTAAMVLSAVAEGLRKQVLPIEEQLMAVSLPTLPPAASAKDDALAALASRVGASGVGRTMDQIKANEAAFRRALGLRDYTNERSMARVGAGDYTNYRATTRKTAGSFRGPEQF